MRYLYKCLMCGLLVAGSLQFAAAQELEPEAGFQPVDNSQTEQQEGKVSDYEEDTFRENLEPRKPISLKQQLIFSRAAHRARLRIARIESRKRQGYSRSRPTIWGGQQHLQNLNSLFDAPWLGGAYIVR